MNKFNKKMESDLYGKLKMPKFKNLKLLYSHSTNIK